MAKKKKKKSNTGSGHIPGAWKFENQKHAGVRHYVFDMIEVGYDEDFIGRGYDILNLVAIVVNLIVSILMTFKDINAVHGELLHSIEYVTIIFFTVDLVLRLWTSSFLYTEMPGWKALLRYCISFNGIVDILSCIPYYLPVIFPGGAVAFRLFRVLRIFRLFRINAYSDSLNVVIEVVRSKAQQLLSSMFIIFLLMLAASLCMYSVENAAQPDVFDNALSGIWWASSSILTVGYGDIYPITPVGKILGTIIAFLGVGLTAIPTGIISAGFVEQYGRLQRIGNGADQLMQFIRVELDANDSWIGMKIADIKLPNDMMVAAVSRNEEVIVPRGDLELCRGDVMVIAAEPFLKELNVVLHETLIDDGHEWKDMMIKDLDISRQTFIVAVHRRGKSLIPGGTLKLRTGDTVVLYEKNGKKTLS